MHTSKVLEDRVPSCPSFAWAAGTSEGRGRRGEEERKGAEFILSARPKRSVETEAAFCRRREGLENIFPLQASLQVKSKAADAMKIRLSASMVTFSMIKESEREGGKGNLYCEHRNVCDHNQYSRASAH